MLSRVVMSDRKRGREDATSIHPLQLANQQKRMLTTHTNALNCTMFNDRRKEGAATDAAAGCTLSDEQYSSNI